MVTQYVATLFLILALTGRTASGQQCVDNDPNCPIVAQIAANCLETFIINLCPLSCNLCVGQQCQPQFCLNGGQCPATNLLPCVCAAGFTGATCAIPTQVCRPGTCLNGGQCPFTGRLPCVCGGGFTGPTCAIPPVTQQCLSTTCLNGGRCPATNRLPCTCPPRFSGQTCATSPCGACLAGLQCLPDLLSTNIPIPHLCRSCADSTNPDHASICTYARANLDVCTRGAGNWGTFLKTCPVTCGLCSVVATPSGCQPNPCVNGACTRVGATGFFCQCNTGFTGTTCNVAVSPCRPRTCNDGTCQVQGNGFFCTCPTGISGTTCQIGGCQPNPCLNSGRCSFNGVVSCTCNTGFTGNRCQTPTGVGAVCAINPCQNNGVCRPVRTNTGYYCDCTIGFSGSNCQLGDLCRLDTCINGGICSTIGGQASCNCLPGFEGINCGIIIACIGNPCAPGTCVAGLAGARICNCPDGTNTPTNCPGGAEAACPTNRYPQCDTWAEETRHQNRCFTDTKFMYENCRRACKFCGTGQVCRNFNAGCHPNICSQQSSVWNCRGTCRSICEGGVVIPGPGLTCQDRGFYRPVAGVPCADRAPQCAFLSSLARDCQRSPDYFDVYCPRTCGCCGT